MSRRDLASRQADSLSGFVSIGERFLSLAEAAEKRTTVAIGSAKRVIFYPSIYYGFLVYIYILRKNTSHATVSSFDPVVRVARAISSGPALAEAQAQLVLNSGRCHGALRPRFVPQMPATEGIDSSDPTQREDKTCHHRKSNRQFYPAPPL